MIAETVECRSPSFFWLPSTTSFVLDDMADNFPASVDDHRSDDKREK
jgi:hypothetical protein